MPVRRTRPTGEVAELFDKYNLITLAVADEHGRLAGIITSDDVITMLRHRRLTVMKFVLRERWRSRLHAVRGGVGPGFLPASGGNDAGGIWTYSAAGAQFGYSLLWTMIPTTIALVVVQEMAARMGAVTGKGLSDLIREEFGFRVTFFLMLALVVTNFGNVMAEFAGVASSLELFGISRYVVVPARGVRRLGARRARHLQQHREDLPDGLRRSTCATSSRDSWRSRTGRRRPRRP